MFLFEFKLSSAHLLVVVGVAAVTLAFGVEFAQTSMFATCSHGGSPVSMIAWIAHAHRVVRQISMPAGRDHSLFLSRVSLWHPYISKLPGSILKLRNFDAWRCRVCIIGLIAALCLYSSAAVASWDFDCFLRRFECGRLSSSTRHLQGRFICDWSTLRTRRMKAVTLDNSLLRLLALRLEARWHNESVLRRYLSGCKRSRFSQMLQGYEKHFGQPRAIYLFLKLTSDLKITYLHFWWLFCQKLVFRSKDRR